MDSRADIFLRKPCQVCGKVRYGEKQKDVCNVCVEFMREQKVGESKIGFIEIEQYLLGQNVTKFARAKMLIIIQKLLQLIKDQKTIGLYGQKCILASMSDLFKIIPFMSKPTLRRYLEQLTDRKIIAMYIIRKNGAAIIYEIWPRKSIILNYINKNDQMVCK